MGNSSSKKSKAKKLDKAGLVAEHKDVSDPSSVIATKVGINKDCNTESKINDLLKDIQTSKTEKISGKNESITLAKADDVPKKSTSLIREGDVTKTHEKLSNEQMKKPVSEDQKEHNLQSKKKVVKAVPSQSNSGGLVSFTFGPNQVPVQNPSLGSTTKLV